jgi:hypothetical protein
MKTLTVKLPDDVYKRAERRAEELGATLDDYVAELVGRSSEPAAAARPDPAALLAALDKGRNQTPVGRLNRDELYDRAVLR